jgi:alpha-tubulin suppressor-like RCC1 family protein
VRLALVYAQVLKPDGVVAVGCGAHHTLAATRAGALWAVGSNGEGQLGIGRRQQEWTSVPVRVEGGRRRALDPAQAWRAGSTS